MEEKKTPVDPPDLPSQQARAVMLDKIRTLLEASPWTQREAAQLCGLTQPRISDLRRGNGGRFSLDALVDIAAILERHAQQPEGQSMQDPQTHGQKLVAEFMAKLAARPIKAIYPFATEASTTERGGTIMATCDCFLHDRRIARVGDVVRYADGSEARIISGAGVASTLGGRAVAIVGSALDNGDRITGPLHNDSVIVQYADEPPIEGLLDPSFTPSASQGGVHG